MSELIHKKTAQKIAILGAESSGKSQLAEALARHYQTLWVPEYLREFVETQHRVPIEDEQLTIAMTQLKREEELLIDANGWLFCDTSPMMTALYSRHYFKRAPAQLEELALRHEYDFTIVTAPDIPWVEDGLLRDSPMVRQQIYTQLVDILDENDIPFLLVEGSLQERLQQVIFTLNFLG